MRKLFLTIIIYLTFLLGAVNIFGQPSNVTSVETSNQILLNFLYENILVIIVCVVVIGVVLACLNMVWALIDDQKSKIISQSQINSTQAAPSKLTSLWTRISERSWKLVPMEKEQDIDMGHDYDGIRELDNSLPPWWLWLFFGTIIWAFGYLYFYSFTDNGLSQKQEYDAAIEMGILQKAKYLSTQGDAIDEKSVAILTDEKSLAEGKEIYVANCQVCHGQHGEGLVGPNFTDQYWIHGGSIVNVFSTIKYGVPEKGMISWKSQLRPVAMQKVSSYILSLQGTNPPNQKEAQGTLYVAEDNAQKEVGGANAVKTDSTTQIK